MKPFVGDHTIETILFTIGGDFSGLHPPSDKTNRFIFIGTGSGDHDADRLRRRRLLFRRRKRDICKADKPAGKISSYVKATNGFNGHNVRFAFAIDKVLAKMKAGEEVRIWTLPASPLMTA